MITPIYLRLSNAYLVRGERPILVDSGGPGEEQAILKALAAVGVQGRDLALIVHTHGHGDHVGSSAALQKAFGTPIAIHQADGPILASGRNPPLRPTRWTARLLRPFINHPFAPVQADLTFGDEFDLRPYGVSGRVIATPGHTAGSVSMLFDSGAAIIGDLLMGGHLGGQFAPTTPRLHYFADDLGQLRHSLVALLAHNPDRLYVGHGGPLDPQAARRLATDDGRWALARR